jgi:cyclopropane fatty-acyl-phospholipid synthase-like methyltransferase
MHEQSPTIANAPLPADSNGSDTFSNSLLAALLTGIPAFLTYQMGKGFKTWLLLSGALFLPTLGGYWLVFSTYSPRKNEKAKFPGKPVEHYLDFVKPDDRESYRGRKTIPMEVFYEKYFDQQVNVVGGNMLAALEYRHDWCNFQFTPGLIRHFLTGMLPEMIVHSRSQGLFTTTSYYVLVEADTTADEEQVRDHYDRGDDFYAFFLGPRMIYTSGIISDLTREESLEELQDNKMGIVCEKIGLQEGDVMLDIGCGWGTLAKFASVHYGAHVTGVTLGRNQTAWGNKGLENAGIQSTQSRILCMDYRDIPVPEGKYNKITCLEMAEHVGVRHFGTFCGQVYEMLEDDGVFFLQIAGLRKAWQYEDLTWGLFMNKYVFPGADASTPLGWVVDKLEGAGFEIKHVDTIGVHYSATLWRWYRNWIANKDRVIAKYGERWFRVSALSCLFLPLITNGSADLGVLPCVLNHRLSSRLSDVFPDHHGQKPQLYPPRRRDPYSVQSVGGTRRSQGQS